MLKIYDRAYTSILPDSLVVYCATCHNFLPYFVADDNYLWIQTHVVGIHITKCAGTRGKRPCSCLQGFMPHTCLKSSLVQIGKYISSCFLFLKAKLIQCSLSGITCCRRMYLSTMGREGGPYQWFYHTPRLQKER